MEYPKTIFYGTKPLEIRLRSEGSEQTFFCLNNRTLHLTEKHFLRETYPAGSFLGQLCREFCEPTRDPMMPCPAFVQSYKVGKDEYKGLASVELHPIPQFEACAGVEKLLGTIEMTDEEKFFWLQYHEDKYADESKWRDGLVEGWNAGWYELPEGWGPKSRRGKFDRAMWWTLRYPALIPQVWLNWLHMASEQDQRRLDENPSRVDFMAFVDGARHVIEIDGPSHYADWDGSTYRVDEREYAKNLKIARSLQRQGWVLTRYGRIEVASAMTVSEDEPFDRWFRCVEMLRVLPFYKREYPKQLTFEKLGVPELQARFVPSADDNIPF